MTLDAVIRVQRGDFRLGVDLHVGNGEVLALLGPNGAGKSTIVRAVAGLDAIDDGRITIDGIVVDDPGAGCFVEPRDRSVGLVFQDHRLFGHMSAIDNVAFGLRARGTQRRPARAAAGDWLERVGIGALASARPPQLSGGEAQRVALARALAVSPRVLLLDEPMAALDVSTRAGVRRELRRHLDSFDGVRILVTHDPVDAYALADRVAIVEGGEIVQTGTLDEVTARPRSRYVADLVGVNLVGGVVSHGVLRTSAGADVVVADAPDGPAFALIRPHSLVLARAAPDGSTARNVWRGTIAGIDRLGDRARVALEGEIALTAEVTIGALDALELRPGDDVHAIVKATEVEVYPS